MAVGRTISASFLTPLDNSVIDLCQQMSARICELIPDNSKKDFLDVYGKISETRDCGAGLGGGKLQRDAICTRGRGGKAPFSNRNLRWHPLVVAENKPSFADEIERVEIEGEDDVQTLCFVIKAENGNEVTYRADKVHEMPRRFVSLPKHWDPHIDRLKHWDDTLWIQNRCVIPALEACEWWHSVETYAVLGITAAVEFYGVDFDVLLSNVRELLENQEIDKAVSLPTSGFPNTQEDVLQCPLCNRNVSTGLEDFRCLARPETWQPGWRASKKREADDSSVQIMHVNPLVENEIRHTAQNVRYGHRCCNVAMTDHSLAETLDFMTFVARAHNRGV